MGDGEGRFWLQNSQGCGPGRVVCRGDEPERVLEAGPEGVDLVFWEEPHSLSEGLWSHHAGCGDAALAPECRWESLEDARGVPFGAWARV